MAPRRPAPSVEAGPSRRRRHSSPVDSDEDIGASQDIPQTQGGKGGLSLVQVQQCAVKLVRLALFHEYQHKVLRRDIITQKVLPSNARSAFAVVFNRAQTILRQKFGMELYELRGKSKGAAVMETQAQSQTQAQTQGGKKRGRRLDAIEEDEEDEDEEEAATATQAAKKQAGSKTYIVRSTLSPEIRALMCTKQPLPMFDGDGDRVLETDYVDSGAIIPWEKADGTSAGSIQMLGIRTVILCLVLCVGRVITDDHLHSLLKRLNLHRDTVLPYSSPDGKDTSMTLDRYLDLLARQQYLEKVKVPGHLTGGEASAAYEWRWGNREAEFSEESAAEWIVEILTKADDGDDDEEDETDDDGGERAARQRQKQRDADRKKRKQTLKEDIVKAAGGALAGDA